MLPVLILDVLDDSSEFMRDSLNMLSDLKKERELYAEYELESGDMTDKNLNECLTFISLLDNKVYIIMNNFPNCKHINQSLGSSICILIIGKNPKLTHDLMIFVFESCS